MLDLLESFAELEVTVVGDLILDRYVWGSVSRISPEAPVPVVNVERKSYKLGGAGNAAQSLAALGADVTVLGRVGDDGAGERMRRFLERHEIRLIELPSDDGYTTTLKTRVMAENQHLLRMDDELRDRVSTAVLEEAADTVVDSLEGADAVLLSDYAKGVVSRENLSWWLACFEDLGLPVVVDPSVDHFPDYDGVRIVTPNETELREGTGQSGPGAPALEVLADEVMEQMSLDALLVTRGERGMALFEPEGTPFHLAARAREVYDVTGAGDTVAALMTLGEARDADRRQVVRLANIAAGMVVGRMGTAAVTVDQLRGALRE